MKKFSTLLLTLLLIFSVFTACSSENNEDKKDKNKNSYSEKNNEEENNDLGNESKCTHEFDEADWEIQKYATCSEEGKKTAICKLCYDKVDVIIEKEPHCPGETEIKTDGYMYSYCSVCGVEISKSEAPRHYESEFKVDKAGYYNSEATIAGETYTVIKNNKNAVIYKFENGEDLVAYANGYFVSEKDNITYLKTVDGKEITNTVSLGITGFGKNDIANYLEDGYLLAYNLEESFSGTVYKVGILKTDGTWLVPLSSDNPMLTCGVEVSANWLENDIAYAGDGNAIFRVNYKICKYYYLVYNFKNNKLITYTSDSISNWDMQVVVKNINYKNGVHRWFNNGNIYDFKDDGTIAHAVIFPEGVYSYSDNNNQYFVSNNGTIFFMAKKDGNIVLMNNKGTVIKDFKAAYGANITDAYHCGDGKWTLLMKNNEGTYYYSATDITGNFKFDPIKCEDIRNVRILTDSIYDMGYGNSIVIDFETGKVLVKSTSHYSDFECNNGIFYDSYATERYFILENK